MGEGPILIVGAGAVGGYIAAHLARRGEDIAVLEDWALNRAAIASEGLVVDEPDGRFTARFPVIGDAREVARLAPRLVLLCTKLADAPEAVTRIERHYDGPYLVTLNALADLEMAEELGAERVMGCIATGLFAHLVRPGEMHRHRARRDGGPATFRLGETGGGISPRLRALTALLDRVDQAEAVEDLAAARWSKLVFNCMTSPLSALHARPIRDLFLEPALRRELTQVALEVVAAAGAVGVALDPICGVAGTVWSRAARASLEAQAELQAGLIAYGAKMDPTAISGMAQDRARGRRTEVRLVNGAALAQARRHGLEAPANAAVIESLDGTA